MLTSTKTEKVQIKHIFSDEELRDTGKSLASKTQELKRLEDDKKAAMSQYKAQLDMIQAEINLNAGYIQNGYQYKNIDCELRPDYLLNVMHLVNPETAEVLKTRSLTDEERQLDM